MSVERPPEADERRRRAGARVLLERQQQPLEQPRLGLGVVVEQHDRVGAPGERALEAGVAAAGEAPVLRQRQHLDARELARDRRHRAVARAVVHDQHAHPPALRQAAALQRRQQRARVLQPVPVEHDHGERAHPARASARHAAPSQASAASVSAASASAAAQHRQRPAGRRTARRPTRGRGRAAAPPGRPRPGPAARRAPHAGQPRPARRAGARRRCAPACASARRWG